MKRQKTDLSLENLYILLPRSIKEYILDPDLYRYVHEQQFKEVVECLRACEDFTKAFERRYYRDWGGEYLFVVEGRYIVIFRLLFFWYIPINETKRKLLAKQNPWLLMEILRWILGYEQRANVVETNFHLAAFKSNKYTGLMDEYEKQFSPRHLPWPIPFP